MFPHLFFQLIPPLPYAFHILPRCELYSLLFCHKGTSVHRRPRPPEPPVNLFLLFGRCRSPTRNNSLLVFAQFIGPCKCISISISSLNLPYIYNCPSPCILPGTGTRYTLTVLFLSRLSFVLLLCFTPRLLRGQYISLGFPSISFHILSSTFSHLTPARPVSMRSPMPLCVSYV